MVRDDLWHPLTMLLVVDMSLLWRCLWAFPALLKASKHLCGIEIWLNCHAVSVIWHRLWDSKKAATRPESTFQAIPQHEKNPFKYVVRVQGCVPKMCWNNLKNLNVLPIFWSFSTACQASLPPPGHASSPVPQALADRQQVCNIQHTQHTLL